MPHSTPEQLALAALGEPLPPADADHLGTCPACREEVASLRRAVDALAVPELSAPERPVPPPPGVWAGIAAATGVTAEPRPEMVAAPPVPGPPAAVPAPRAGVPAPPRRSRVALAAAAALLLGTVLGAGAVALGSREAGGRIVAATALDPLGGSDASGSARVVRHEDGSAVLQVELAAGAPSEGYYEVWLLDEAVSRLVPVGVVPGAGTAELGLPPGLDLGTYAVVDVSVEPLDGDPSHSGVSVARGLLAS